jgi:NAD(P)H-dependent flavin oxidoreductase YrpB (nitropropane dioxygenase family)
VREAGREDLLMNAAGQISGLLNDVRPAGDILQAMVAEASEIISRKLPAAVTVGAGV